MSKRTFRIGTVLIAAVALIIRVLYARTKQGQRLWGDALDYFWQAHELSEGKAFVAVLQTIKYGTEVPTAAHPPGFVTVLGFLWKVGIDTPMAQRYAMGVLGTASVLIILACVTKLLGRRAGLIAGLLAAIYPQMWINDGMLMSETLFVFGIALGFYGVYAYHDDRRLPNIVCASFGFTLAASGRAESLLLFPLVVVPLVLMRRSAPWRPRIGHLALAAVIPLAMVVPWFVFNASRFAEPVPFTTGLGRAMRQGSCPISFSGTYKGSYAMKCFTIDPVPEPAPGHYPDESLEDAYYRKQAIDYMKAHKSELLGVVLAREGRVWGVWRPGQQNLFDHYGEGRGSMMLVSWAQRAYWLLGVLAIAGVWRFRRRRIPIYPLFVEIALTAVVAAITFGNTRYRAGVEVGIVMLAAATIDGLWNRIAARRTSTGVPADSTETTTQGRDSEVLSS